MLKHTPHDPHVALPPNFVGEMVLVYTGDAAVRLGFVHWIDPTRDGAWR